MTEILLLPMPHKLDRGSGTFAPSRARRLIQLDPDMAAELMASARAIQAAAAQEMRSAWQIAAGWGDAQDVALSIAIVRAPGDREQYTLEVRPDTIEIRASTPAMAFYAAQTLAQLPPRTLADRSSERKCRRSRR
jgi:N-acetyl-beta-hexosaminidase